MGNRGRCDVPASIVMLEPWPAAAQTSTTHGAYHTSVGCNPGCSDRCGTAWRGGEARGDLAASAVESRGGSALDAGYETVDAGQGLAPSGRRTISPPPGTGAAS